MPVITVYRGARAPIPVDAVDLPWDELATCLEEIANEPPGAPEDADVEAQKRSMLAWAPHALTPGATRGTEGVDHVSLLVVDVDNGATPEAIVSQLHAAGYASLVYESAKSTPEAPRFRIVCPVTTPITVGECRETRTRFAEALGLAPDCGVLGAQEAAKLFFSGRAHDTPPRRVWRTKGASIDPATLPENSAEWVARAPAAHATASPHLADLPPVDAGLVTALGDWRAHAGRKHALVGALAGVMRKLAYTPYQWESAVRAWLPTDEPTVNVDTAIASWAKTWDLPSESVSGFQELERLLGTGHAEIVESAAIAGSWGGRAAATRPPLPPSAAVSSGGQPWATPVTGGDPLGTRHLHSDPPHVIEYYCEGLKLAPSKGKISLIAGLPGAGKGPIADHLAVAFATGLPAFGTFPLRPCSRVMLLDAEGIYLTMEQTRRCAVAMGVDPRALDTTLEIRDLSGFGTNVLDDRFYYALAAAAPDVLVVDSYTSLMLNTGLDPNKIEFGRLAGMLGALNTLVICVAHANKAPLAGERPTLQQVAGSFALAAMAQTGIVCWHPNHDAQPNLVSVACMRGPRGGFKGFDIDFQDVDNDGLALRMINATQREARADVAANAEIERAMNGVLAWLTAHPAPWPRKMIREAVIVHGASDTGLLPEAHIAGAMARLTSAGLVTMHLGVGGKPPTYEIRSVQNAPGAVALSHAGDVVTAPPAGPGSVGMFRRSLASRPAMRS